MSEIHSYILERACMLQAQGVSNTNIGKLADFLQCSASDCVEALADAPFSVRQAFGLAEVASVNTSDDPHRLLSFRGAGAHSNGDHLSAFRGRR